MRTAGILLPISSLPSPHGIGTLGRAAFDFVDFLAEAGQSLWQLLPVGPTGHGNSPYQSESAFAGNPYFIDLDLLCKADLLLPRELDGLPDDPAQVPYEALFESRYAVLEKAAARQNRHTGAYRAFCEENAFWLEDYALFMAIKESLGWQGLAEWPPALHRRRPEALNEARQRLEPRIDLWRCMQYFFYTQWARLKRHANEKGVALVGDVPIYVAEDSSDFWANPGLFLLDENGRPSLVAGVPPDAFSATGQLWGNPLYHWPAHRDTGYAWWLARLAHCGRLYNLTRIDHFRGFESYYAVPATATTAEKGRWMEGPGMELIHAVQAALPDLQLIAEDLGFLTEGVHALLRASGYPGMKVLQFAFDSREESDYLPHHYLRHTVVYTGTHDNTTSAAWEDEAPKAGVAFARRYLGLGPHQSLCRGMVRAALACVADTAVIPMQDWLELGAEARMNTPSTLGGANWRWRLQKHQLSPSLAARIRLLTRTYGRLGT